MNKKVPYYHSPEHLFASPFWSVRYLFTLTEIKKAKMALFDRHRASAGESQPKVLALFLGAHLAFGREVAILNNIKESL